MYNNTSEAHGAANDIYVPKRPVESALVLYGHSESSAARCLRKRAFSRGFDNVKMSATITFVSTIRKQRCACVTAQLARECKLISHVNIVRWLRDS